MAGFGIVFLPRDESARRCAKRLVLTSLAANGLAIDEWLPVHETVELVIVGRPAHVERGDFERRLSIAKSETEQRATAYELAGFSIASLTCAEART